MIVRKKDAIDNPVPSGNGLAAMLLARLRAICGRDDYGAAAEATCGHVSALDGTQLPSGHVSSCYLRWTECACYSFVEHLLNLPFGLRPAKARPGEDGRADRKSLLPLRRRPLALLQLLVEGVEPTGQLEAGPGRLLGELDNLLLQLPQRRRRPAVANLVDGRTNQAQSRSISSGRTNRSARRSAMLGNRIPYFLHSRSKPLQMFVGHGCRPLGDALRQISAAPSRPQRTKT